MRQEVAGLDQAGSVSDGEDLGFFSRWEASERF